MSLKEPTQSKSQQEHIKIKKDKFVFRYFPQPFCKFLTVVFSVIFIIMIFLMVYLNQSKGLQATERHEFQHIQQNIPHSLSIQRNNLQNSSRNLKENTFRQIKKQKINQIQLTQKYTNKDQRILNEIFFCVLFLEPDREFFQKQLKSIFSQTYKNWRAYSYVQKDIIQENKINSLQRKGFQFVQSFKNRGKNIYDGVVNKCPRESMMIIIKSRQILASQLVFSQLSETIKYNPPSLLITKLKIGDVIVDPNNNILTFQRKKFFGFETKITDLSLINNITEHIRIFKAQDYLKVPFIELLFENQTFIQSQLSYILPILQIELYKLEKSLNSNMKNIMLSEIILLQIERFSDFNNPEQIYQIGQRFTLDSEAWIYEVLHNRLSVKKQPTLWQKSKELNVLQRNISKQKILIPAFVHQIWIGPPIPQFKLKFMSRFKDLMPDYQYRLWGDSDITKQNFPLTFQTIKKIQQFQRQSNDNKGSMIADLMKYEIIYQNGGFYYDTNYEPFKSLDHLRHYPLICVLEKSSQFTYYQASGVFGAEKKSPYLQRLLLKQNLESIQYTSSKAHLVSGPQYFASKGFKTEDYYFNIKTLTPDKIFPYIYWSDDDRRNKDHCLFKTREEIPQQLEGTYDQILQVKGLFVIFPCMNQYKDAYGIDHFDLGGSWQKKISDKQRQQILSHSKQNVNANGK